MFCFRRKSGIRITTADATTRLTLISTLPIATDHETPARAWRETLALARAERLTTYDAAYLELAIRLGLPLATLDRRLGPGGQTSWDLCPPLKLFVS